MGLESEVDNLVVLRDQESFGAGYCFLKEKLFVGINLGCKQELIFNGIYTGVMNLNDSVQEKEHRDFNSSNMCQGSLHNGSLRLFHDEDQSQIDRLDDIFMDSVLEEDVTNADNSSDITFNDILMEQHYIPSNSHSLESSKDLKTHDFPPPLDWENAEVSSTSSPKEDLQAFFGKVSVRIQEDLPTDSETHDSLNNFLEEESMLQELEKVTAQFTDKKRICFRDALYRLAENSKPLPHLSQDDDIIMDIIPILTSLEENLRNRETEVEELIAGLMFSRMKFADKEDNKKMKLSNCGLSQHKISYCPLLARLAEVPIVPT